MIVKIQVIKVKKDPCTKIANTEQNRLYKYALRQDSGDERKKKEGEIALQTCKQVEREMVSENQYPISYVLYLPIQARPISIHMYSYRVSKVQYNLCYLQSPFFLPSNIYTPLPSLNNLIKFLRNIKATNTKSEQSSSNSPKPPQITFVFLTWDPDIHTP